LFSVFRIGFVGMIIQFKVERMNTLFVFGVVGDDGVTIFLVDLKTKAFFVLGLVLSAVHRGPCVELLVDGQRVIGNWLKGSGGRQQRKCDASGFHCFVGVSEEKEEDRNNGSIKTTAGLIIKVLLTETTGQ